MEENFKTEQDLSEERLQEITGGCLACETDLLAITTQRGFVNVAQTKAQLALNVNDTAAAIQHRDAAAVHLQNIQTHLNNIGQRHPEYTK